MQNSEWLALVQRGDDLYHSSHSLPSNNSQGESDGRLLNTIRTGRDESGRMHIRLREEYEIGDLRWKRWSGEWSELKCVKGEWREGDLTRKHLLYTCLFTQSEKHGGNIHCCYCCSENQGSMKCRNRKLRLGDEVTSGEQEKKKSQ